MLKNEFDLVPMTEFFMDEGLGSSLGFKVMIVGLGILITAMALCIVGRRVYKSLQKKHLKHYHKMKSKKKTRKGCARPNKEYKRMRKFMRNVMKSGKLSHEVRTSGNDGPIDDIEVKRQNLKEPLLSK